MVRRVVRDAAVVCLGSAGIAWVVAGTALAPGILGGGVLIGISFFTLESGVAAIVSAASGHAPSRRIAAQTLLKLVLRYALLGFLAYVMIARLRLHPIGLVVGASSIAAAVFIEAVRLHTKKPS